MKDLYKSRLHYDMGEFNPKFINDIAIPKSIKQLQKLVKYSYKNNISIYPISTGKNWGLGSKKSASPSANLISLERLNSIRELNLKRGYAVIEAGVTQKQLHNALKGTDWKANFTHSCSSTSVIGNSLERGVGTFHQRPQDIVGFEVITGQGKLIRTGAMWHKTNKDFYYKHEVGPGLYPLFFQSNFGVVTAAIFKLIPKPTSMKLIEIKVEQSGLNKTLKAIKKTYKYDLVNSVFKIYNSNAHKNYGYDKESINTRKSYIGYGTVYGVDAVVEAKVAEISKILKDTPANFKIYTYNNDGRLDQSDIDPTIQQLNASVPTKKAVHSLSNKGDLDVHSKIGWVLFAPMVPFDMKSMKKALKVYKKVEQNNEVDINTTFNIISSNSIDLVTSIRFNRHSIEERNTTHKILDLLHKSFNKLGYYPYRLDIDHQNQDDLYSSTNYTQILKGIKSVFDPKGIIAPGRYGIS